LFKASLRLSIVLLLGLSACAGGALPDWEVVDRRAAYTVKAGDTLYSISKSFDLDYRLLARRNRISYPYTIYVGQHLQLWRTAPKSTPMPIKVVDKPIAASQKKVKAGGVDPAPRAWKPGRVSLAWPLKGRVSSGFGLRGQRMHDGIDIAAPEGAEVHASAAGEVVYADQRLSGYGKLIIVRHSADMFTAYAHNQRNLVKKGDRVQRGELIARVGSTGRASRPHLHFEVRRGSTPVDPRAYLPKR
jgi:murein DD-endopeptidase MepM/ murein hydrolase activator NlpD